jgi:hypothetical protein
MRTPKQYLVWVSGRFQDESKAIVKCILIGLLGVHLQSVAATIPEQLPGKRADAIVLHTMGTDEMLQFILDSCEDSLHEYETAWVQETATTGYWKLPYRLYHGNAKPQSECVGAMTAYFLLYFEREKPMYAGKYSRDLLLKRMQDFRRGYPTILGSNIPIVEFMAPMIQAGKWIVPSLGVAPVATNAQRDALYADVLTKRIDTALDIQFSSGMSVSDDFFYYDNASASGLLDYYKWMYHGLLYYGRPQDRAVNWVEVDRGHALSEAKANASASIFPNASTKTHTGFEYHYLNGQKGVPYMLLKAAIKGRGVDQIPPPFRDVPGSRISSGFTEFVHHLRDFVSPDGSSVWPTGTGDKWPETFNPSFFLVVDAVVNKNPESAAYLSRTIQPLMWLLRRPFAPTDPHGGGQVLCNESQAIIPIYYIIKHWGLPTTLPSWDEVQAEKGGVAFNRNGDFTVHRNPFKFIEIQAGSLLPITETLISERNVPVCNLGFTPWKQGHGMHFTINFPSRFKDHFTTKGGLSEQAVAYYQSSLWRAPITSLLGNYLRNPSSSWDANVNTRKVERWDDGFRLAFEHNNSGTTGIKRAVFSFGGRVTAIVEKSNLAGEIAPIRFWVGNMDSTSQRGGWLPKVSWKINLPNDLVIPFADVQATTNHQSVTLSSSTKWYNVDDLVAVAVPQAAPLVLSTDQFPQVRETISFGPMQGGAAVVYSGVEKQQMDALAAEVKDMTGLPTGWKGIQAKAPEGYRVYGIAKFSGGTTNWNYVGKEAEGAPIFSVPTSLSFSGESKATFSLPGSIDSWSEEPHFYVTSIQGTGQVTARGDYHRLELSAQGSGAQVTVRFFGGKVSGAVTINGNASWSGTADASLIRTQGVTVNLMANQSVFLNIKETGSLYDDRLGPYVHITAPVDKYQPRPVSDWTKGFDAWVPISGLTTIKADAGDRSGIDRVEFYLNNAQLIGTDFQPPYECTYDFKQTHCQFVYAVAYDKMGNVRKSVEVPFGDGSVLPYSGGLVSDADGDGMLDNWETTYGLNPSSAADASGDADGDGFTNVQEYLSKTNPILSSSRLHIDSVQASASAMSFGFPSQNGVTYGIEFCDQLNSGNWNILTNNIVGNGGVYQFTDPNVGSVKQRFYRLKSY